MSERKTGIRQKDSKQCRLRQLHCIMLPSHDGNFDHCVGTSCPSRTPPRPCRIARGACCQAQEEHLRLPGYWQPATKKTRSLLVVSFVGNGAAPGSCALADRGLALEPRPIRGVDEVPVAKGGEKLCLGSKLHHSVSKTAAGPGDVSLGGPILRLLGLHLLDLLAGRCEEQSRLRLRRDAAQARARRRWSIHWSSSWAGGVRCASSLAKKRTQSG